MRATGHNPNSHLLPADAGAIIITLFYMSIVVFDFDGVLAVPYTDPEQLFPGVAELLVDLKQRGDIVLVSSFNPRAYHVLRTFLEQGIIAGLRAGSRQKWWEQGDGTYSDALHRYDMDKGLHIADMLAELATPVDATKETILFFDDDEQNIMEVKLHAGVAGWCEPHCCLVESDKGACTASVKKAIWRVETIGKKVVYFEGVGELIEVDYIPEEYFDDY